MDMEYAGEKVEGDREGGLYPLHRQAQIYQRGDAVMTLWHRPQDYPRNDMGRGGATQPSLPTGEDSPEIHLKEARPQTKGESAFVDIKWEITRTPRPTKAQASWISQENQRIADIRAVLRRAHQASAQEVRQAQQSFQRALRCDMQQRVREAGEEIDSLLESDQKNEAWKRIASWYRQASGGRAPPSREHLDQIATERADL